MRQQNLLADRVNKLMTVTEAGDKRRQSVASSDRHGGRYRLLMVGQLKGRPQCRRTRPTRLCGASHDGCGPGAQGFHPALPAKSAFLKAVSCGVQEQDGVLGILPR